MVFLISGVASFETWFLSLWATTCTAATLVSYKQFEEPSSFRGQQGMTTRAVPVSASAEFAPHDFEASEGDDATMRQSTILEQVNRSMGDIKCMGFTGGTCLFENCASFRGPTNCSWGMCMCAPGTCSGTDGICYATKNTLIASGFTLTNVRWPSYAIRVPSWGNGIRVSRNPTKFSLYQVAGSTDYFLSPENDPYSVLGISMGKSQDSSSIKYDYDVERESLHARRDPRQLALRLVRPPRNLSIANASQDFMVSSVVYPNTYFSMSALSWSVNAHTYDDGAGSYWIAHPPLNVPLQPYYGPLCNYNCGSYGSGSGVSSGSFLATAFIILASLAGVCLCCVIANRFDLKGTGNIITWPAVRSGT